MDTPLVESGLGPGAALLGFVLAVVVLPDGSALEGAAVLAAAVTTLAMAWGLLAMLVKAAWRRGGR